MKLSDILWILAILGILSIFVYLARVFLSFAFSYWFIFIPIIIYFFFARASRKKNKPQTKPDDEIEDAEFEIIQDDDNQ